MRSFIFYISAFLLLFSCQTSTKKIGILVITDTFPKILISGLGDVSQENAMNCVGKKYGFQFLRVGGCVIEKKLQDSIIFENNIIYQKLESKYGNNWRDNFYSQVDIVRSIQYQVGEFLINDSEISILNSEYTEVKDEIRYEIEPDWETNSIKVHGFKWKKNGSKWEKLIYYSISIDPTTKKITKIS